MSLLDAWIQPTEATVAVDTDGAALDGSPMPTSKLLALPHLGAVLALRGQAAFLAMLFVRSVSGFGAFDELTDAMGGLVAETDALVPGALIAGGPVVGNELLVVGWSERRSRMVGLQYVKRGEMVAFSEREVDRHVSPWDAKAMAGVQPVAPALERLARSQVRWMRESFPGAACGGRLLIAHLTRKSVSIMQGAKFPEEIAA